MGLNINQEDIQKLVQDKKLMDEVVKRVLDAPRPGDNLVEEIVNKLTDVLEDDPSQRRYDDQREGFPC